MNYVSRIGNAKSGSIEPRFCLACWHACSGSCSGSCSGGCKGKCNNQCSGTCGNNCTDKGYYNAET